MELFLAITIGLLVVLNFVVLPLLGWRVTWRKRATAPPAARPAGTGPAAPAELAAVEGYAAIVLARLAVHAARITGAGSACVLFAQPEAPDRAIVVAEHGLDEDLMGRCLSVERLGGARTRLATLPSGTAERSRPVMTLDADELLVVEDGGRTVLLGVAGATVEAASHPPAVALPSLARLCALAVGDLRSPTQLHHDVQDAVAELAGTARRWREPSPELDVRRLAMRTGLRLGLDHGALAELEIAALLGGGSAGAVAQPDSGLTDALHAYARARRARAAQILSWRGGLEAVALLVALSGESWDGTSGFGLAGERIPLGSRILAACEAVPLLADADDRPPAEAVAAALREVQAASGTSFDPTVVAALSCELLGEMPDLSVAAELEEWARADAQYAAVL